MSYWSSEKLIAKQAISPLVTPFDEKRVQQCAYELSMGSQGAVSCDGNNRITYLEPRQAICVPPGQFGLLLTEETVTIPNDSIAFISLKTSVKSQGLVNVSGFHVDPGFSGRLKFWIYNAGNQDINFLRGDPLFLIWYTDLDSATADTYKKNSQAHCEITAEDLRRLQGRLSSPAELAKQINRLEHSVSMHQTIGASAIAVLLALVVALAAPLIENLINTDTCKCSRSGDSSTQSLDTSPSNSSLQTPSAVTPASTQPATLASPSASKPVHQVVVNPTANSSDHRDPADSDTGTPVSADVPVDLVAPTSNSGPTASTPPAP